MRKKKERRKDEEKIYEHLSDFGTALSGLLQAPVEQNFLLYGLALQ